MKQKKEEKKRVTDKEFSEHTKTSLLDDIKFIMSPTAGIMRGAPQSPGGSPPLAMSGAPPSPGPSLESPERLRKVLMRSHEEESPGGSLESPGWLQESPSKDEESA